MSNQFILVRHATCQHMDERLLGRTVDAPLDAVGQQQAESIARWFDGANDLLIVASPRLRAQQTAMAIAERTHADVVTSFALDELDFGHWSGCTFEQLADDPHWQEWNDQRSTAATPGGECIVDVQARVLHQLRRLQETFPGRCIVLVTHAEVIRAVLLHWLEAPIDSYRRLAIHPASLSTVTIGASGVRIEGINRQAVA